MLYQVNTSPRTRATPASRRVQPGVFWVFTGFALISGVFYMFYLEPRLKKARRLCPAAAQA